MKMKQKSALSLLLAFLLLCSCTTQSKSVQAVKTATPKALEQSTETDAFAAGQAIADGANTFAFKLSAHIASDMDAGENLVLSPLSVWLPLSALVNATQGDAQDTLLSGLSLAGFTASDVNRAASRMLYSIMQSEATQLVNAYFIDQSYTVNADFAQLFADYYRGQAFETNFTSSDAVDAVNAWASKQTRGKIDHLVDEFQPDTRMVLSNAIYFSDLFSTQFNESDSYEDTFHAPHGDSTAMFMKQSYSHANYYEDARLQAIPLYFVNSATLYILLPKDGDASALLADMTTPYFDEIQGGMTSAKGTLHLPRFTIAPSQTTDFTQTLDTLFGGLNFPITQLVESEYPFEISRVLQKAMIEVDENGATAAAATVIEMYDTAAAPPEEEPVTFEMRCDKPFVFVLSQPTADHSAQVLFTGIVNQP